jgi:hypothetical protein
MAGEMIETLERTTHKMNQFLGSTEEIEIAIERNQVTFPMFMKLLYRNLRPERTELRERLADLYFRALPLFMTACGGISESFYADEFVAGVVLTRKGELLSNIWWDEFKFDTIPARSIEADINDLQLRTGLYLSEDHRRMCTERIFRLYKTLITSLHSEYLHWVGVEPEESALECSPRFVAEIQQLRRELNAVLDSYHRIGLARGQVHYVTAAALGAAVTVALTGIAIAFGIPSDLTIVAGVLAGGAVGALLSVLERLTRGALRVEFESGFTALTVSGITRPVVGALSGLTLLVLVKGSIVLPLVRQAAASDQVYFFCGLALIAGFSERLLKDVLGNASGSLGDAQHATDGGAKKPEAAKPPAG